MSSAGIGGIELPTTGYVVHNSTADDDDQGHITDEEEVIVVKDEQQEKKVEVTTTTEIIDESKITLDDLDDNLITTYLRVEYKIDCIDVDDDGCKNVYSSSIPQMFVLANKESDKSDADALSFKRVMDAIAPLDDPTHENTAKIIEDTKKCLLAMPAEDRDDVHTVTVHFRLESIHFCVEEVNNTTEPLTKEDLKYMSAEDIEEHEKDRLFGYVFTHRHPERIQWSIGSHQFQGFKHGSQFYKFELPFSLVPSTPNVYNRVVEFCNAIDEIDQDTLKMVEKDQVKQMYLLDSDLKRGIYKIKSIFQHIIYSHIEFEYDEGMYSYTSYELLGTEKPNINDFKLTANLKTKHGSSVDITDKIDQMIKEYDERCAERSKYISENEEKMKYKVTPDDFLVSAQEIIDKDKELVADDGNGNVSNGLLGNSKTHCKIIHGLASNMDKLTKDRHVGCGGENELLNALLKSGSRGCCPDDVVPQEKEPEPEPEKEKNQEEVKEEPPPKKSDPIEINLADVFKHMKPMYPGQELSPNVKCIGDSKFNEMLKQTEDEEEEEEDDDEEEEEDEEDESTHSTGKRHYLLSQLKFCPTNVWDFLENLIVVLLMCVIVAALFWVGYHLASYSTARGEFCVHNRCLDISFNEKSFVERVKSLGDLNKKGNFTKPTILSEKITNITTLVIRHICC